MYGQKSLQARKRRKHGQVCDERLVLQLQSATLRIACLECTCLSTAVLRNHACPGMASRYMCSAVFVMLCHLPQSSQNTLDKKTRSNPNSRMQYREGMTSVLEVLALHKLCIVIIDTVTVMNTTLVAEESRQRSVQKGDAQQAGEAAAPAVASDHMLTWLSHQPS